MNVFIEFVNLIYILCCDYNIAEVTEASLQNNYLSAVFTGLTADIELVYCLFNFAKNDFDFSNLFI
jgi:hypothetical protein